MNKREVICTGNTIEEAKNEARTKLNLQLDDIEFEILQQPEKKKFGIFGGSVAKVKATEIINPYKSADKYLRDIVANIDPKMKIESENTDEGVQFRLLSEDENVGALIGHRGETLQALQYLTGLVANKYTDTYFKISINVENYRQKREKTLQKLAKKLSYKALKSGKNIELEHMNPYERKIMHAKVQSIRGVKSWSEGEGTERHIIIGPDGTRKLLPNNKKKKTKHNGKKTKYPAKKFEKKLFSKYEKISSVKEHPTDSVLESKNYSSENKDVSIESLYGKINQSELNQK